MSLIKDKKDPNNRYNLGIKHLVLTPIVAILIYYALTNSGTLNKDFPTFIGLLIAVTIMTIIAFRFRRYYYRLRGASFYKAVFIAVLLIVLFAFVVTGLVMVFYLK